MVKSSFLFVALLCLHFSFAAAQNWGPLNPPERFNYSLDGSGRITTVLFAELVIHAGNDSILYLNSIVTGGPSTRLAHAPQFLMLEAHAYAGGLWNFKDSANIALYTQAPQGFSWQFDSLAAVDATVDGIYADSVFAQPDSVKRLLLSTGDTVLLSQGHGILQWPQGYGSGHYHRLVGIKGRDLGKLMPTFREYNAFKAGDLMETEEHYYQCPDPFGFPCICTNYTTRHRVTIDSVQWNAPTLRVFVHGTVTQASTSPCFPIPAYTTPYNGSFKLEDSADHILNHYPDQLLSLRGRMKGYWVTDPTLAIADVEQTEYFDRANYAMDQAGRLHIKYNDQGLYYFFPPGQYPMMMSENVGDQLEYIEGVGLWHYSWSNLESAGTFNCLGYYNGVDTIGVISSPVGVTDATDLLAAVSLYPNPTTGRLTVSWSRTDLPEGGCIEFFALDGKLAAQYALPASLGDGILQADLSGLCNGLYAWRMRTDRQVLAAGRVTVGK